MRAKVIEDPQFRSFVWVVPEDADVFDPEVRKAANPALGKFRLLTDFEARARQAEHTPSSRNAFKNLFLNQAVDLEPDFLPQSDWEACGVDDTDGLREGPCYAGLDLSALRDLACLSTGPKPASWISMSGCQRKPPKT